MFTVQVNEAGRKVVQRCALPGRDDARIHASGMLRMTGGIGVSGILGDQRSDGLRCARVVCIRKPP